MLCAPAPIFFSHQFLAFRQLTLRLCVWLLFSRGNVDRGGLNKILSKLHSSIVQLLLVFSSPLILVLLHGLNPIRMQYFSHCSNVHICPDQLSVFLTTRHQYFSSSTPPWYLPPFSSWFASNHIYDQAADTSVQLHTHCARPVQLKLQKRICPNCQMYFF